MDNRQQRTLEMFQRIQIYLKRTPVKPEPLLLRKAGMRLQASMQRIEELAQEQRQATDDMNARVDRRKRKLRREHMMPLVRLLKPELAFAPGAEAALHVPHARSDARSVGAAALRIAKFLEGYKPLLVEAGCARTYLNEFKTQARELATAAKRSADARQRRSRATAAMAREFEEAMKTVTIIEGILMHHVGSNKTLMELWRNQRRVAARLGRPKGRNKPK